jgi:pimeloyl-ACP methyl ester carboxylesterase
VWLDFGRSGVQNQMTMNRLALAFALVSVLAIPPSDDRGRPVILLVHGRGLLDRDSAELRRLWLGALNDGSKSLARQSPLAERDVRLVWYADVLDPRATAGCDYASGDRRAARDAAIDPNLKTAVSFIGGLLNVITGLSDDSASSADLRALAADASFLTDARRRCAAEQRLGDALDQAKREGRPVIVVAHSLGALVAYDYLSSRADSAAVRRLVTIGSPVGSAELRRLLIGGDSTDVLAIPRSVVSWINIRQNGDQLAAPLSVGRDTAVAMPAGETDPHEMVGYLRNAATSSAVLTGWCGAFTAKAPAECAEIVRAP